MCTSVFQESPWSTFHALQSPRRTLCTLLPQDLKPKGARDVTVPVWGISMVPHLPPPPLLVFSNAPQDPKLTPCLLRCNAGAVACAAGVYRLPWPEAVAQQRACRGPDRPTAPLPLGAVLRLGRGPHAGERTHACMTQAQTPCRRAPPTLA
eukprot:178279-Chlamydomonas_euryale.AAC.3